MRGTWTIYRRELAALFLGPLAWVLLCLALFVNGYFLTVCVAGAQGEINDPLMLVQGGAITFWALLIVLPPLLTMRMISEEAKSGTLEFLQTAPVRDLDVVLGKLLAATTLLGLMWASSLAYGLLFTSLGQAPDWGPVLTSLLGAILLSALLCSIGLLASAATDTPLIAAFLAFVANIALLSVPLLGLLLRLERDHPVSRLLAEADLQGHYQRSFLMGVLDTRSLVFFLVWTAFFVFCATRSLEARRWRA
jgi:ABC-2 type transport system permease protein